MSHRLASHSRLGCLYGQTHGRGAIAVHARWHDSQLNLDEYLVVDILPWGKEPDLFCVSTTAQLQRARECFEKLTGARQNAHAVFLIGNDLRKGILYLHKGYEALQSPQAA